VQLVCERKAPPTRRLAELSVKAMPGNPIMKDLTDAGWIKFKGVLFLFVGVLASVLLIFEHPEFKTALLLGVAVWCFCRFYYFAFYVIERYVDPAFRFSGLGSFVVYLLKRRR
jgi:hypothetical protein